MPKMQAISVSIADHEGNRHSMCSMGSDFHYSRYNRKIVTRIRKYKAPWSCKRLPMLTMVGSWSGTKKVFAGQSLDLLQNGERLGYDEISSPGLNFLSEDVNSDEE